MLNNPDVSTTPVDVPEDLSRLTMVPRYSGPTDLDVILKSLRDDQVVLVQHLTPEDADRLIQEIAAGLSLADSLTLQAAFASIRGHRHNVGKSFMSVNKRTDYQFITPHSEGDSIANMQLAAFYCFENTTDGGETILMNVDDSAAIWESLREKVARARPPARPFTPHEIAQAKLRYKIQLPNDVRADDRVLREHKADLIPGLVLVDVLAKPRRIHSLILDRPLYGYWDSIASIDHATATAFERLLRQCGLFREPAGYDITRLDNAAARRVWRSDLRDFSQLFKSRITRKLAPGELIVQNNISWTHAACSWTPASGTRKIAAAFA